MSGITYRKVFSSNVIDCFFGDNGWEDWTRYERIFDKQTNKPYLKYVNGDKPPKHVYDLIRADLINYRKGVKE